MTIGDRSLIIVRDNSWNYTMPPRTVSNKGAAPAFAVPAVFPAIPAVPFCLLVSPTLSAAELGDSIPRRPGPKAGFFRASERPDVAL